MDKNRFIPEAAPRINRSALNQAATGIGSMFATATRSFVAPRLADDVGGFGRMVSGAVSQMAPRINGATGNRAIRGGFGGQQAPAPRINMAGQSMGAQGIQSQFGSSLSEVMNNRYNTRQIGMAQPPQVVQQPGSTAGGTVAGSTGTAADAHNAELTIASGKYGVPAAALKVILIRESSGDWESNGYRVANPRPESGPILPFVGIFQSTWNSWGCDGDFSSAVGNKQAQINCMAKGMAKLYADAKATDPSYGWKQVFSMYFSGKWNPTGWRDELGMSDTDYVNKAWSDFQAFSQSEGGSAGAVGSGAGGAISMVWGNKGDRSLDYGYNAPSDLGLYTYGDKYGLNGVNHTGVDIPMALNEPAYSPVSGTVTCACTGNGPGTGGSGCAAFNDTFGSGCGRIEIQLDNGHTLIFGHMSQSTVRVGQRVTAGAMIGKAGGMNGPHTHLEYRIPDRSTPSGWRIVDPVQYLGGAAGPVSGGTPATSQPVVNTGKSVWGDLSAPSYVGSGSGATFGSVRPSYVPVSSWRK